MNYKRRQQVKKVIIRLQRGVKELNRIARVEADAIVYRNTMKGVEEKIARDLYPLSSAIVHTEVVIAELYDLIEEKNPNKID